MQRYVALLADMESAGYLEKDPDGDWVRYEDAQAALARAEAAERSKSYWKKRADTLEERADQYLLRAQSAERADSTQRAVAYLDRAERAESEAAALRADRSKALARADFFQAEHRKALDETFKVIGERDAARAEAAALRAEVERLKARVAELEMADDERALPWNQEES